MTKRIILIFTLLSITLAFPASVLAQSAIPMTISPARQEIEIEAGDTSSHIVKLINTGDTPMVGTIKAYDFMVTDSIGTPQFIEEAGFSSKYAAASWIQLPYANITLPARGKVDVPYKVVVPANAAAGGHYAGIVFEMGNASENQNQSLSAVAPRVATLLYISLPGDIVEAAQITRFYAPNFSQHGPVAIDTQITNSSSVHIRPTGVITVSNMFGDTVAHLTLKESNIFPEAAVDYQNTLPGRWLFGRYKAELNAQYGTTGKTLEAVMYFTVLPLTEIAYVAIILIALIILILALIKRSQKHQDQLENEVESLRRQLETKYKDPRPQA